MPGAPRRRPFPCDINVNGYGLMLGSSDKGMPLVATRPPTQDEVAPTDFGYGSQNPKFERVASWRKLTGGFGLKTQKEFQDNRYYYTIRADMSVSGEYWLKGPDIIQSTPTDHPGEITKFFELGGNLFALNGQYVQKATIAGGIPTGWTTVATLSAPALDVTTFGQNGFAATWAYFAMGDSIDIYKFDGTTATLHNEGANHIYATKFCVVGNDLYRSLLTNQLSKVNINADPFLWASWGADNQFYAGDKRYPISSLAASAVGDLVIFKTNAVYTLTEDGQDVQYFPFLAFGLSPDNGRWGGSGQFLNDLHVTYGGAHYAIGPDMSITADGPERFMENDSIVRGRITSFVGVGSLFGLGALWDDDSTSTTNGRAHLMKYGSYVTSDTDKDSTELVQRLPTWHGSISQTFSVKITTMFVSSIGAPSGHTMTYVGFADGSYAWFRNPCTPNPAGCSSYRYTTAQAEVYLPYWFGGFFADPKTLRSISVSSLLLSGVTGNTVLVDYKLDPATISWTPFGTIFQNSPLQKANFLSNTASKLSAYRVLMLSTSNLTSPQVTGVGLHHSVHPDLIQVYEFHPLAVSGLLKRDGSRLRLSARRIREIVEEAVRTDGSVNVIFADESIQQLSIVDYAQGIAWNERLKAWQDALTVTAMQFTSSPNYGTYGRLEPYIYQELELRTYGGLEQL